MTTPGTAQSNAGLQAAPATAVKCTEDNKIYRSVPTSFCVFFFFCFAFHPPYRLRLTACRLTATLVRHGQRKLHQVRLLISRLTFKTAVLHTSPLQTLNAGQRKTSIKKRYVTSVFSSYLLKMVCASFSHPPSTLCFTSRFLTADALSFTLHIDGRAANKL